MFRMALTALALILMTSQVRADEPHAPTPPPLQLKSNPAFISGPTAEFSEEARSAGEFGKVTVTGKIGVDGRFHDLSVLESSKSPRLDAAALAAASASIFSPAVDVSGQPTEIKANMPFEFSNAKTPGKGGGALRYKCGQFSRDYDWWFKTWPADKHDDFYLLVLGLTSIANSRRADGSTDFAKFAAAGKDFDQRWRAAVETCRQAPDRLFIDVFKPEGDWMRRAAGG